MTPIRNTVYVEFLAKVGRGLRFAVAAGVLACQAGQGAPATAGQPVPIVPHASYPEGPLWHDGALYFVEYAANNIQRWNGQSIALVWHRDGCGASALAPFRGHLLIACYDDNSLVEIDDDGSDVHVYRSDRQGKPFRGPNDFTADGRGGLYFSASGIYDIAAPISGTVLHLSADGVTITELADTIHYPNGLALSKDGQHLLVAEMLAGRILSFPIAADGSLGPRTVWARLRDLAPPTPHEDAYTGPDGLKLGPDENYYIAQNGSGRVLVVSDDRKLVQAISVPTPYVTNVAFGPDGSVFITGAFDQWQAPYPGVVYRLAAGARR